MAQQYVEEMRDDWVPASAATSRFEIPRYVYWGLGFIATLLVIRFGTGLFLQEKVDPGLAPPPARLIRYESDPCTQRQATIIRAIAAYRRDHGEPPADLKSLQPAYLTVPPVDPESGRPYTYTRKGEATSLSCPSPDQHRFPPHLTDHQSQ